MKYKWKKTEMKLIWKWNANEMNLNEQEMRMECIWICKWYEIQLNENGNNINFNMIMQGRWIHDMIWNFEDENEMYE